MKKLIIALLLCICAQGVQAQEVYNSSGKKGTAKKKDLQPKGFDMSRLVIGGGANLNFGTGFFVGGLSPMIGYKITDNFAAGIAVSYLYYRNKYEQVNLYTSNNQYAGTLVYDRKTSLYNAGIWARYLVWRNFFVHVQPEIISIGVPDQVTQDPATLEYKVSEKRETVPAALVGAGIRQPISGSLSLYLMGLYDVIQNTNSPYYKRLDIRVGFNIGF